MTTFILGLLVAYLVTRFCQHLEGVALLKRFEEER